ncbi:MAG: hypothetical protein KJ578_12410 [Bacteroidetes bacterium]|nr:hypothetical protein [Bacteroidota bacterium]MBU2558573.1 hypothetical protein [Bacteroidota bacterium]
MTATRRSSNFKDKLLSGMLQYGKVNTKAVLVKNYLQNIFTDYYWMEICTANAVLTFCDLPFFTIGPAGL